MSEPGGGPAELASPDPWHPTGEQGPQGWKRLIFPGIFLVLLGQTLVGVAHHSQGLLAAVGYAATAAFCVLYLAALPRIMVPGPAFRVVYASLYGLFVVGLWAAHEDALPMALFLGVLAIARFGRRSLFVAAGLVGLDFALPALFGWPQQGQAFGLAIGLAANFAFFRLLRANVQLAQARAEIARLAAEGERQRIARDLHDLLGHSLTTITVKAALARRLAESGELDRSRTEITQLEDISRGALSDVRAAVAGYRDVTLAGELVNGRELARTLGIELELPPSTDVVPPEHQELFGWVTREAITNLVRHARATRAAVRIGADWIEITDDGSVGPGWSKAAGHGLRGLDERVAKAGGRISAGPAAGGGWRVRVDVGGRPDRPDPGRRELAAPGHTGAVPRGEVTPCASGTQP